MRVEVKPELLQWARVRAGPRADELLARFPKLLAWEHQEGRPTFKQLEAFAHAARVPIGYLFLDEPPDEPLPIPDLRTMADRGVERPSPDLLDTIYLCQERQVWYRDFAHREGEPKRGFVGAESLRADIEAVAAKMRRLLGMDLDERRRLPTWTDALRLLIGQADRVGVLVMVSGVVGSNNQRKLDPEEFRGFALSDDLAPLVFVNGADTKAAQMFTLAHELAHLWLGESALSDVQPITTPANVMEKWCNRVAAELLVPMDALRDARRTGESLPDAIDRLARHFKVSTLVVLRRLNDIGAIDRETMRDAYRRELARLRPMVKPGGGDFYLSQAARASKRFARALIANTFEGQTSYTEATHLLGIRKVDTLRRFGAELGVGY